MSQQRVSHQQIFKYLQHIDTKIDTEIEQLATQVQAGFEDQEERFTQQFNELRKAVAPLATKDFVDQKIASLRGEWVQLRRR